MSLCRLGEFLFKFVRWMFCFVCFVVACVRVASFMWMRGGSSMSRVWRSHMDMVCGVYGCAVWM